MSQGSLTVATGSGAAVRAAMNAALQRLATKGSGTSRPSDIATGEFWIETDNPGGGIWSLWLYDGSSDILIGTINSSTHAWTPVAGTTIRVQTFTSSGTYTPNANMTKCLIEAVGGGGGGGGTAGPAGGIEGAGGGGGAGEYAFKLCTASDIGASKTVTIGAAGTAGSAGNNAGGAGGATSVGSLCVANGGSGGGGTAGGGDAGGASGAGGTGGTGDILVPGQAGGGGHILTSSNAPSGSGGSGPFGAGGTGVRSTTAATGTAGSGRGSGGAGGQSYNGSGTAAGGAGTAGFVKIIEFCSA